MKRIMLLIGLILFGSLAFADDIANKIAQIQNELAQVQASETALEPVAKAIHAEAEQISFGAEASHKNALAIQAEEAQYNADQASYHASAASPCHYPAGHPEQCSSWQQSMDARYDVITKTYADLETKKKLGLQLAQAVEDRVAAFHEKYDAAIQQHRLNKARIAALQAQLNALQSGNDACKQAILNGSNETMHSVCGSMFDGNNP